MELRCSRTSICADATRTPSPSGLNSLQSPCRPPSPPHYSPFPSKARTGSLERDPRKQASRVGCTGAGSIPATLPARLTSEDPVSGAVGVLLASSRRPKKIVGRCRQVPRRRTRRLLRRPSAGGAGGGASPSGRDSGDPGGCGDPCDVKGRVSLQHQSQMQVHSGARTARPITTQRMRPRAPMVLASPSPCPHPGPPGAGATSLSPSRGSKQPDLTVLNRQAGCQAG